MNEWIFYLSRRQVGVDLLASLPFPPHPLTTPLHNQKYDFSMHPYQMDEKLVPFQMNRHMVHPCLSWFMSWYMLLTPERTSVVCYKYIVS